MGLVLPYHISDTHTLPLKIPECAFPFTFAFWY